MTIARLSLVLPFVALAACQTTTDDPAPQTPGATVTATNPAVSDAAAAASDEARSGVIPDTLQAPAQ